MNYTILKLYVSLCLDALHKRIRDDKAADVVTMFLCNECYGIDITYIRKESVVVFNFSDHGEPVNTYAVLMLKFESEKEEWIKNLSDYLSTGICKWACTGWSMDDGTVWSEVKTIRYDDFINDFMCSNKVHNAISNFYDKFVDTLKNDLNVESSNDVM